MREISLISLKRLPKYLEVLYQFKREGLEEISATKIGTATGVHMTQVRKDLAFTGVVGIPKVGHNISDLISAIETFLNWDDTSSCFLVGAGNLGKALLGFQEFDQRGIKIIAAFDTNSSLHGKTLYDIPIYPLEKLQELARRLRVHIAILTVPPDVAQEVAELLVKCGILAVWNFTPKQLQVPEGVIVEDVDMFASLAVLSRRLAERLYSNK